ncbi:hypothetical protein ASG99_16560 [Bacillus sp. Soil768D1]|nr:hypothetical protein ASG99_16560 [Bacillus sp. Soil768D1]
MDRYYVGREGVTAIDCVSVFKLAWDLCGEAFGQRLLQYERYYTGDPIRKRAIFYNTIKPQGTKTSLKTSRASISSKRDANG